MKRFSLALFVMASLAICPAIKANSITYTATVAPSPTNVDSSFEITQFNPALGTLNSITITLADTGSTSLYATSTGSDLLDDLDTKLTIGMSGGGTTLSQTLYFDTGITSSITVTPSNPYNPAAISITGSATDDVASGDFLNFEGLGEVPFSFTVDALTQTTESGGNLTAGQTTDSGADVTVTYDYTSGPPPPATPEPSPLLLLGSGLFGLAVVLWGRARMSSNMISMR